MDDLVTLLLEGERHGTAPCFGFIPDGDDAVSEQIDFGQFVGRARRVAQGLVGMGVGRGDRVALFARPDIDYMVSMAATLLVGAVAAPINHQFRHRELAGYLSLIEPAAIVTGRATDPLVVEARPQMLRITTEASRPIGHAVRLDDLQSCDPAPPAAVDSDDVAFIMHTSGTTGLPKGVVRTHGAYRRFVDMWAARFMSADDRVLNFMPMYHQGGVMMSFLPAYRNGRPTYQLERFTVPTFWSAAQRYRTQWAVFMPPVPSFLLLQHSQAPSASPLRWAMTGGRVDHWAQMQDTFDLVGHSGYGSTETTMVTMTGHRVSPAADGEVLHGPMGGFACGRTIDDWGHVRVVRDDGSPAGSDEIGQLEFQGPGVFDRYFGNTEATSAAFTADGWFRPGDVGYVDSSGQLFMVDRSRDLIRRSGENIAPREIEDVLSDHPGVEEVAVVPVEDDIRGQEIRACVVLRPDASLHPDELFDHCRQHLSPFKVPRFIDVRSALPHTPTFKIKKDDLIAETTRAGWVDRMVARTAESAS